MAEAIPTAHMTSSQLWTSAMSTILGSWPDRHPERDGAKGYREGAARHSAWRDLPAKQRPGLMTTNTDCGRTSARNDSGSRAKAPGELNASSKTAAAFG
jgi:hypothetical protein